MSIKAKVNGRWVDVGGGSTPIPATGVQDVQINGTSCVTNGIAEIPVANEAQAGIIPKLYTDGSFGIGYNDVVGLYVANASSNQINNRNTSSRPITPNSLDAAVKAAMCDGKGAAWSDTEKAAAKDRLGITHYVPCYTNVTQLGLTLPCSTIDIVKAMPNNSMAMITAEVIASSITDVPWSYGVLSIRRGSSVQRTDIEYKQSSGAGGTLRGFASFNSNTDSLTWYKYTATQV